MFINFWYPACFSDELADKPLKVKMLGLHFALFRDASGKPNCLSNTCIHRGGSLSCRGEQIKSQVVENAIQCPYHGWEFDGTGQCIKIPSQEPGTKIPERARIDAYPTQEKYGIVFVFLGDLPEEERPPILEAPEVDMEGWGVIHQSYMLKTGYRRSIENAIDPAHNEFVHPTHGFSGKDPNYFVPKLDLIEEDWGVGFMTQYNSSGSPTTEYSTMKDSAITTAGSGTWGASQFWTKIQPGGKFKMHQYVYDLPVDEFTTRVFLVSTRNAGLTEEMQKIMMDRNKIVAQQDIDILNEVEPVRTPPTMLKEFMVRSDSCIVRYREHIKRYEDKGWRIDLDKFHKEMDKGNVIFAIPSPRRRKEKRWVIDPIPLISGKS
ncbi:MAG TPA: aromatic ring-hydroxylating dioxygenase subunit alpha [Hellea balneolensis]|uniref:Aromatic ring-hydroxylating dioxygenase subunit alpha n=1 Tax=Hellea balneolensis TaxID=287478 RepID=A0A7C5LZI7_9PROT|nr:aromatic ring-hydroxylating dioxygenase subunit alpha [Hellea balneolensis]